jgi:hypothetical protein
MLRALWVLGFAGIRRPLFQFVVVTVDHLDRVVRVMLARTLRPSASSLCQPRAVCAMQAAHVHVEARIEKAGLKIPNRPPPPKGRHCMHP